MFITKLALDRRTFLRGVGATVALPLLDAMVPALSAKTVQPARRLGFVYVPNGIIQEQWIPATEGAGFELPPILKPISPVRDQITVVSHLAHLQANTFGDGVGDHPRASAVWLSGVHAWDRTRPGMEVRLGTTADQLAARVLGKDTQVPSLELVLEKPTQIACDTDDCFFVNTISWRNPTTPNPTEAHPRIVFDRLFGDGGTAAQRMARLQQNGSILDSVLNEVGRLQTSLGPGDRTKLTEYLDSVREIEQRIQSTEKKGASSPLELPDRPVDIPETFEEHAKLMYDLLVLGYRADVTRIFTLIMARELSSRTYPNIGVPEQHHAVSHHRNDPELIAKKAKIDTYHVSLFDYFLEKLQATPDGDGTLLDHSLILYGGGIGNGNLHEHTNLPLLMAGKLGGQVKPGRHVRYPDNTPMTNLLLSVLDKAGVRTDKLGDSTGPLKPDYLTV
ncbi:MAG TPA: DUF1552 domain-containing protein [Bryobacteraceae bacterium]|nr:DUF1552 domain-containing protein [Bryobacteraceae bacterium]